jgi:hypothetical protein
MFTKEDSVHFIIIYTSFSLYFPNQIFARSQLDYSAGSILTHLLFFNNKKMQQRMLDGTWQKSFFENKKKRRQRQPHAMDSFWRSKPHRREVIIGKLYQFCLCATCLKKICLKLLTLLCM